MIKEIRQYTPDERRRMIAEAAYFRAEHRDSESGGSLSDWLEAEAEVDALLKRPAKPSFIDKHEKQFSAATEKLKAVRSEIAELKSDLREEWRKDLAELGKAQDSLRKLLTRLKDQGQEASQKTKQEAERVSGEFAEMVHDIGARLRSARRGRATKK